MVQFVNSINTSDNPGTTFAGFIPPTKNWFAMPNNWTDITADMESLAELKVVEYVLRHTWGYHEFGIAKTISVDEFMRGRRRADGSRMDRGTGLKSDRSVKDGLKLAEEHGYLECVIDNSDQGRIKKSYRLRMAPPAELEGCNLPPVDTTPGSNHPGVEVTPQGGSIYPSEVQILPLRGANSTPRTEKETLERNSRKTPKKNMSGADAPSPRTPDQKNQQNLSKNQKKLSKPTPAKEKPDPLASASPSAKAVIAEWLGIFKTPKPVTKIMAGHAETLAGYQPEPGEIIGCREWMYATDSNGWYKQRGMDLGHVVRDFERWRSLKEAPSATIQTEQPVDLSWLPTRNRGRQISSFDDPNYDMSSECYPSDAEKAAREGSYATQW